MNPGRVLGHVASTARSFGVPAALHELQQRALARATGFGILVCLAGEPQYVDPVAGEAGGLRARLTRREEMLAHARAEYDMTPAFVENAFDRNDECLAVWDGDRLASFTWHSSQSTAFSDDLMVRFDPAWIYMYKAFTHPDYRGRRLNGLVSRLAVRRYAERGRRGVVGHIRSTNFPSLRAYARSGYRPFGRIYLARAPGRWVFWATPGCAAYGFRVERITARATPDARA